MAGQLKLRRGTTSQLANFIGSEGELTYNTTLRSLVLHDGVTLGGVKIPYLSNDLVPSTMLPTATESVIGASKIATTAIAQAGTNDTDIMTPAKVRSVSFGQGQTRKSRTLVSGVEYTNTNNKPIIVGFNLKSNQGGNAQMPVNIKLGDITVIGNTLSGTTEYRTVYEFTILPQEKYTFTISNATTFFDAAWEIS